MTTALKIPTALALKVYSVAIAAHLKNAGRPVDKDELKRMCNGREDLLEGALDLCKEEGRAYPLDDTGEIWVNAK